VTDQALIATINAGYADGIPRTDAMRTKGALRHGESVLPVAGTVCMDLTMLDVGAVPAARIEDEVVIFGRQNDAAISADDLARALGTINYEIVCDLTPRVARAYSG